MYTRTFVLRYRCFDTCGSLPRSKLNAALPCTTNWQLSSDDVSRKTLIIPSWRRNFLTFGEYDHDKGETSSPWGGEYSPRGRVKIPDYLRLIFSVLTSRPYRIFSSCSSTACYPLSIATPRTELNKTIILFLLFLHGSGTLVISHKTKGSTLPNHRWKQLIRVSYRIFYFSAKVSATRSFFRDLQSHALSFARPNQDVVSKFLPINHRC